jgi:hypothetical protein
MTISVVLYYRPFKVSISAISSNYTMGQEEQAEWKRQASTLGAVSHCGEPAWTPTVLCSTHLAES